MNACSGSCVVAAPPLYLYYKIVLYKDATTDREMKVLQSVQKVLE